MTTNNVTGEPKYKHSPSGQRIGGWLYSLLNPCCGEAGKWFEPRYKPARERTL
jgi:hypothetical protein